MGESESQFLAIGDELLSHARSLAALTEESRVTDIGCGYGRFAHALKRWPLFRGSYFGFDILPRQIAWCRKKLGDDRFVFQYIDVRNDRYNPAGTISATEVAFGTVQADVAVLTSVFTHMWAAEILHYLNRVYALLRPGGRAYVTAFLMNPSQRQSEAAGRSRYPLRHVVTDYCSSMDKDNPLHVIAYAEDWLVARALDAGFVLAEPVSLGSWCGRENAHFQDVIVLGRPTDS